MVTRRRNSRLSDPVANHGLLFHYHNEFYEAGEACLDTGVGMCWIIVKNVGYRGQYSNCHTSVAAELKSPVLFIP